jgi:CDP-glycerol glycerophosphotransferase
MNAFNTFYQNHKDSYLIIIGGYGNLHQKTVDYAKRLSCGNNIIIIKSILNPICILKKCDLFILSSFYEGLGLAILEADTVGVPVISTDIPGPKSFIMQNKGYLVENSEAGILQGMNDFISGKVKVMNIDFEEYNNNCKIQFENLLYS